MLDFGDFVSWAFHPEKDSILAISKNIWMVNFIPYTKYAI